MHRNIYKTRLLRSSILLYFVFFAISTLSYTPVELQLCGNYDEHGTADIKVPRLFLLELIGSEFTRHSGSGKCPSPFGLIFLKKRAVLPTEELIKKTPSSDHELVAYNVVLPEKKSFVPSAGNKRPMHYSQPLSFYSGVSPPEA